MTPPLTRTTPNIDIPGPAPLAEIPARRRTGRRRLLLATMASAAAALPMPAAAGAHGGISVASGGAKGVRIAVQGSETEAGQVDLATTLTGPGTGEGSKVVYWIRPTGRQRAVRVATDRDESGIHHAEIPTTGRGSWQDWDVSAYVTLSTGKRLRITNDTSDPPGPATPPDPKPGTTTEASPVASPSDEPTLPATTAIAVEDVSGEGDGAPGWVIPSLAAVVVLALVAVVLGRRRRPPEER